MFKIFTKSNNFLNPLSFSFLSLTIILSITFWPCKISFLSLLVKTCILYLVSLEIVLKLFINGIVKIISPKKAV